MVIVRHIVLLLLISILIFALILAINSAEFFQNQSGAKLVSPLSVARPTSSEQNFVLSSTSDNSEGWESYVSENHAFSFQYPISYSARQNDSKVEIYDNDSAGESLVLIQIRERALAENESVQTTAEKDIDEKLKGASPDVFVAESIIPIAIGLNTAITYKLSQGQMENSYFYIPTPQNMFLEAVILGKNHMSLETINIVDRIVYSIGTN